MAEFYMYPVYHSVKLTDIRHGSVRVLVRDQHADSYYHTGGVCKLDYFGGAGLLTPTRDSWSVSIDGCETVYKRTRKEAIDYIAAWWDKHLAEKTGRPLSTAARLRIESFDRSR